MKPSAGHRTARSAYRAGAALMLVALAAAEAGAERPGAVRATGRLGIAFSTFLGQHDAPGALGWDAGYAVAVDDRGYIYVAGAALGPIPTTPGALQPTPAGSHDAFLVKLSPDGQHIVYGTYLGGSAEDLALGIAVDRRHDVYLVGNTRSGDLPTRNAHQAQLGGYVDAFVAKVSAAGGRLLYSTYLGGSFRDLAADVAVDAAGNAYVVGTTNSHDFPTRNAFQVSSPDRSTSEDCFLAKLSPDGALVFSTLIAGSEDDVAFDVAVGADGSPVIVGQTASNDFPLRFALQARLGDGPPLGVGDAFVAKLGADGKNLVFGTYLGGSRHDWAEAVAVDRRGRILVVGETASSDFPTRQPLQASLRGESDGFVARLAADGRVLDRATYLGGTGPGPEPAMDVAPLAEGGLVVLGATWSGDFPLRDPIQSTHGGQSDLFVAALTEEMAAVSFGTLLGGSDLDPAFTLSESLCDGSAVAVGPSGEFVLATDTWSADFPLKNNVLGGSPTGYPAAAVVKIDVIESPPPNAEVCTFLLHRAPPAAIAEAMANPEHVPGWGELCRPGQPPGPLNFVRRRLSLQTISKPYHVLGNGLVFKCGCP